MIRSFVTLLRGELTLQRRQAATMFMLLVLPLVMGIATVSVGEAVLRTTDVNRMSGGVVGQVAAVKEDARVYVPDAWRERLADVRGVTFVPEDQADAVLEEDESGLGIVYAVDFRGMQAVDLLERAVRRSQYRARNEALREAGLTVDPRDIVDVDSEDHATNRNKAGATIGTMLPGMLLFVLVISGILTGIDVFTGEKERRTIETLLTTGVDRRAVVLAKLSTVTLAAGLSGVLYLVALTVGQRVIGGAALGGTIGPREFVAMLGIIALLAAQVAGFSSMLGIYAEDYKSGSMLSAPAMLLIMAPAAAPFFPIELTPLLCAVPFVNAGLAARDLCGGALGLGTGALVLGFSVLHAGGAALLVQRMLDDETALLGTGSTVGADGKPPRVRQGLAVFVLAFLALWFFGAPAQALDLVKGMVFTQLGLFASIGVGAVVWLGLPLRSALALERPTGRDASLALAAGLAVPGVGVLASQLQAPFMPVPSTLLEMMAQIVQPDLPILVPLFAFALLPALCEEVLFRGAILGLMRQGNRPWVALLANAVLFGLFHVAVHRWFPTGVLGLLIAVAVWRSGSLWVGVVIHFLNNALLISLSRTEVDPEHALGTWGLIAVAGGLSALSVAAVAAMRGPGLSESGPKPPALPPRS